ncbi:MAG: hypothetical protein Ta2B_09410 [Termitinemataceae bacterium]|nr:MAG: hypothetical protein Ta2B_09410 [Termitinemataceae bacterium]
MLKQGIQSRASNPELKTYGCFFYDILKIIEAQDGITPLTENINLFLEHCKERGYIDDDCYIKDHQKVYELCGGDTKLKYHRFASSVDFVLEHTDYITEKVKLGKNGKELTHFTAWIDGKEWDSLDPARPTNTGYKIKSYRWWA